MEIESEPREAAGKAGALVPESVRSAFGVLAGASVLEARALSTGLLHQTLRVRADNRVFILQRVSDVFAPEIHDNIEAVTRHLAARGQTTFELIRTRQGSLYSDQGPSGRWRLMTAIEGLTYARVVSSHQVRSAGSLVGQFHAALDDFEAPLAPLGIPYRDTPLYLERLDQALDRHTRHDFFRDARELTQTIRAGFARLGEAPVTPDRVIHGDLKLSNILFEEDARENGGRAFALIDLDTLMRAPLWVELGDAWRSWCNRQGEDESDTNFDLEIFEAALEGFFAGYGRNMLQEERDSLLFATERISLELATRYVTDLLEESYFAWDETRFASAAEHNRVRARGQLALFEAAWDVQSARRRILSSF
jgi:Ser/Thr protein kinase RdoA (MazF antagonist)